MLRQPIVVTLGHVDHGKTSLLDCIRKTAIAEKEAGGITQSIGSTEIPKETIRELSGPILDQFKFDVNIPGLLFIDTPGHEAFATLRRRGGSIADIAILVVDINEGMMPQTRESVEILRESGTPFIVAVNKIDRVTNWSDSGGDTFLGEFEKQSDDAKGKFEELFYKLVDQLKEYDYNGERFDRVSDFKEKVAMVPISSKCNVGIPELLAVLTGVSQQYLKDRLVKSHESSGTILEVKKVRGLGTTVDTIIYDGSVCKDDYLVIGGSAPKITKIRALLTATPLQDMRTEKQFTHVDEVTAAAGVKIAAPNLDDVVAGLPIRTAHTMSEAETLLEGLQKEKEEIEVSTDDEGLIIKADTVGSLEAAINIFKDYPIKQASIGPIGKKDIISAEANNDPLYRAVVGFNAKPAEEAARLAKSKGVKILTSEIIYHLVEEYDEWSKQRKEEMKKSQIEGVTRPGKFRILPGLVFRGSNPAIVGCEIVDGVVKPGTGVISEEEKGYRHIGEIRQIQAEGENVGEARKGERVAISIRGPTMGRQITEGDELYTDVKSDEYRRLSENKKFLSAGELSVLEEIRDVKRKTDPRYGM